MQLDPNALPTLLQSLSTDLSVDSPIKVQERRGRLNPVARSPVTVGRRILLPGFKKREKKMANVTVSAKLLKQARDDLLSSEGPDKKEAQWGFGTLGSIKEAPLASNTHGSHKPPMLHAMENTTIQALSRLNTRFRNNEWLLPTAVPDVELFDWNLLSASVKGAPKDPNLAGLIDEESEQEVWEASDASTTSSTHTENTPQGNELLTQPEYLYRTERMAVFHKTAKLFASSFKTYRPMLAWILRESTNFAEFLAGIISSLNSDVESKDAKIAKLEGTLDQKESEFKKEILTRNKQFMIMHKKSEKLLHALEQKDGIESGYVAQIAALEQNVTDLEEVKVYLQKQISRLERKVHDEQNEEREKSLRVKLNSELDHATKQLCEVRRLHEVVLRENKQYKETIERFEKDSTSKAENKETLTPRPDWEHQSLSAIQYNGSTNKTVQQTAKLLAELQCANAQLKTGTPKQYFIGAGDEATPAFLRHEGVLQNMQFTLADTLDLVKQFWAAKVCDAVHEATATADYMTLFLSKKYENAQIPAAAYSLWDSLHEHSSDVVCLFTREALLGTVEDAVYMHYMHTVRRLREKEANLDAVKEAVPFLQQDSIRAFECSMRPQEGGENEGHGSGTSADLFRDGSPLCDALLRCYLRDRVAVIDELREAVVSVDRESPCELAPIELVKAAQGLTLYVPAFEEYDHLVSVLFATPLDSLPARLSDDLSTVTLQYEGSPLRSPLSLALKRLHAQYIPGLN